MMSTRRHHSIAVGRDGWIDGDSAVDSFISPWYANAIKLRALDNRQRTLPDRLVHRAVGALHGYTPTSGN
jgi:hypothetical protein